MENKEVKSEKTRKSEKLTSNPYREFLDLDTDEEDLEQQETPVTEEELSAEPEKPVFSEQDLFILVQYVKNLTVLPSLKESDWNKDCNKTIQEFFQNPTHIILSIFYEKNTLTANLEVPNDGSNGFTYFLRTPWQIYTVENFLTTVTFGFINKHIKNSFLKFMENMYAPTVFSNSNKCPHIIKNDLYLSLHEFLICLIEHIYKQMNLTILYIPREILHKSTNYLISTPTSKSISLDKGIEFFKKDNEEEKNLLARLEKIVRYWIKQIREALANTLVRKNIKRIREELEYCSITYYNLNCLYDQISREEIRLIIEILQNVNSPSTESIQELIREIQTRLMEITSNLTYLNILSEHCDNLDIYNNVEHSITKIILLILFIWTESPFYGTSDNIKIICQALSTQIILQCKGYIDLDAALGNDTKNGIQMIKNSIYCCETYKKIYDNVTMNVTEHISTSKKWPINNEKVFSNVDIFLQRCNDLIDICNASVVFERCSKVGVFGSAKGVEYETYCQKIENLFHESMNEIRIIQEDILNVKKRKWSKYINKFRNTIIDLENMVKNLIENIFKNIKNIEEGIEAIYALQRLKTRKCLQYVLDQKWTKIWKIFGKEVEYYSAVINAADKNDILIPNNLENIIMLSIKQYLERQYILMIKASDWIGDCAIDMYVLQQFKQVMHTIETAKKLTY